MAILLLPSVKRECALKYAHIYMRMEVAMPATHTAPRLRTNASGKRATNLSLSTDVLDAAKHLEINISQVCDSHLREVVRREQERKWREDHADFISAYNATIAAEGLPLDEWRSF
jgi:antitoxin CcdA